MTAVAELESPLNELTTGLTKMLNHIAGGSPALQKRLFIKVARGLNAYDLLFKRIRSRNLTPISQTDLNAELRPDHQSHPTWGTIARNNSLGRPTLPRRRRRHRRSRRRPATRGAPRSTWSTAERQAPWTGGPPA
jgi:hypothetical protein